MPFQNLPKDYKKHISDFLTVKEDFPNLRLISKAWHEAIKDTKRGKIFHENLKLQPSNLDTFYMKIMNQVPKFGCPFPIVGLWLLTGMVMGLFAHLFGQLAAYPLGVKDVTSIAFMTSAVLIFVGAHRHLNVGMTNLEKLALANAVMFNSIIICKGNKQNIADITFCINAAGLGAVVAGNQFQMFYNSKKKALTNIAR